MYNQQRNRIQQNSQSCPWSLIWTALCTCCTCPRKALLWKKGRTSVKKITFIYKFSSMKLLFKLSCNEKEIKRLILFCHLIKIIVFLFCNLSTMINNKCMLYCSEFQKSWKDKWANLKNERDPQSPCREVIGS